MSWVRTASVLMYFHSGLFQMLSRTHARLRCEFIIMWSGVELGTNDVDHLFHSRKSRCYDGNKYIITASPFIFKMSVEHRYHNIVIFSLSLWS